MSKDAKPTAVPLLGAHFSIAGGLERAVQTARKYQCPALQIFTKNASTWKERVLDRNEIAAFTNAWQESQLDFIAAHSMYLINLASPDRDKQARSRQALTQEIIRADLLGIQYVVYHPGAHMGKGVDHAISQVANELNRIFEETASVSPRLLLETTAGQGSSIGHRFEELADILSRIKASARVGVCLDTCHVFAAGYDIRTREAYQRTMDRFDDVIGLQNLYLVHVNDSKKPLGARIDRHEHIGLGKIGTEGFRLLMNDERLQNIPKILETPKGDNGVDFDAVNLKLLHSLVGKTPK